MISQYKNVKVALVLMFALTACNLPLSAPTPTPTPTARPTSTLTVTPSPTSTFTPAPTKVRVRIRTRDQPVNCRFGPGIVFEIISGVKANQSALATGRTSDQLWLYIQDPGNPGGVCWVVASAVDIEGNIEPLPVVNAPLVTVTRLEARAEPAKITVSCDAFPQVFGFVGEITTNGPTVVTWRWEVSTGDIGPEQMLVFESAETKTVQEFYRVNGPNDYKVKIHVLEPNERMKDANFFALCTP